MMMFAHFFDEVHWVKYKDSDTLLINCKYQAEYNGREIRTCKDSGPCCCMGKNQECAESCQCPNNKKGDVNNG